MSSMDPEHKICEHCRKEQFVGGTVSLFICERDGERCHIPGANGINCFKNGR